MSQYDLEKNIYNFYSEVGISSGRELNISSSIKWVRTYPSCWPNYVFDVRFDPDKIEEGLSFLKDIITRGIAPNSWFIGPVSYRDIKSEALSKGGFIKSVSWPGMIIDLNNIDSTCVSPGDLSIREVTDLEELKKWSYIINSGMFGGGFDGTGLFRNLIGKEELKLFLGYQGKIAVSTALLYLNSDIASLFLITTLPQYRRRGIGTQVTLAPLKKARELGYKQAGLFATSAGERIYKKIGFRRCCDFDIYCI